MSLLRQRPVQLPGKGVINITEIYGSASLEGGHGQTQEARKAGEVLPAGTLTLEDEVGLLEFAFSDGTRVRLRGPAELVFADDGPHADRRGDRARHAV